MSEHLPDCDDYAFSGAGFCPRCERICICRQVRRVEQRVLEQNARAFDVAVIKHLLQEERSAALDAAREAVNAQMDAAINVCGECTDVALAAIDALLPTRVIDRSDIREISVNTDGSGTGAAALTEIASER